MERYFFHSTLLVPVKDMKSSVNFFWAGTLKSENERVDVIAFKTDKKDDFVPMMKADIEVLQKMEQTDKIKAQLDFITDTFEKMAQPVFVKVPNNMLLQVAQDLMKQVLWKNGQYLPLSFTPDNTVFISGVSGVLRD